MPNQDILDLQPAHIRELQNRYERAMADHGYDSLLIASGAAPYRYRDDQAYVFQGFGPFLHWTGLAGQEHSWLLVRPGQKPVLWLYQPVDFWHANPVMAEEPWLEVVDVRSRQQAGAPELDSPGRLAIIGDPLVLEGVPGDHNPAALVAAVEETRVHKTPYEIECLAHANRIALAGHRAAREAFLAGDSEFGISLAYQQATGQREVEAPYHSIIGLNEHAGTLHYQYYDLQPPRRPRSLLIDAGVRYRGYCSDITRTTAGPDEPRFTALVHGLEKLQLRLCEMVSPGVDYVDIHRKAHLGIAALLSASGLVSGLADEAMVEQGITRAFFPHGMGHFLGIQVHDVAGKPTPSPEDAPFLRLTRTLEAGMVVTIEPGLYFIPSLLDPLLNGPEAQYLNRALIDELKSCGGIRIEDNVVVTAAGARNLTRECE
ncbi:MULTISPECIES: Xaa-Pro dipeptidase [Marinobacter]|uniref:Xaa-Pro dipeptidase n=1 Tax=Marinobacter TaxID=2742 RepID=UPI001C97AD45|nr:Xaa-Pro dipeptidase [Marinobacter nauticus]MBY6193888.1 Xaa-Pro dipeptidase [Marinobacter nauticus]MBY6215035.1 Xaa-Pro dipeptidase [Marinobacter nauticus]